MEFLFFRADDTTLFTRTDAESGNWAVQEMTLTALFPYDPGRVIERGMRVGFDDPGGGGFQSFEIRKVRTYEPDHYQEITAENIAISELTDCHMQEMEISSATAASVLTTVLNGTGWSVGNDTSSGTSSADLSMGSVWQNICAIRENWNVIITPRITYNAGGITGRYLDIAPNEPVWRGVRLSINKNADEMGVTYDDTSLLTAMYGYGASRDDIESDDPEPVTFADVVWTATEDHPAKPSGQTYIEDPEATALYGRNGRARFGFYQNSDIKDGATLLDKTWASLKNQNEPTVTIDCMVRDLYRLGYADQPIRVNDLAMIDIEPIGAHLQRTIIQMDVDLIDPTATRVTIGTYIPNIVYINHDVAERTGVGGRGGSNRSKDSETKEEAIRHEFEADINANNYQISLRAYQNDLDTTNDQLRQADVNISANGVRITAAEGKISNHDTTLAEHQAAITTNATNISAEVTNRENADTTINGRIDVEAGKISQIVSSVGQNGQVTAASIILAINADGTSGAAITASHIQITGNTGIAGALEVEGFLMADEIFSAGGISSNETVYADAFSGNSATIDGDIECETVTASGAVDALIVYADESVEAPVINADTYAGYQVNGVSIGLGNALKTITITPPASGSSTYTLTGTTLDGSSVSIGTIDSGGGGTSSGLVNATVANNVLTITKSDGTYVNFSKATTLTGVWGSGSKAGTYIVNATQTNINTSTGQPETTNVGSWDIRFGDTIGSADVALNAVIGTGNPDATGSNIIFPVNIGTATSGTMTTQVSLTRSVNCEAVRGMATSNALTVESQTDAQWADLTDVTDISSSITGGGKYLITATPKYGTPVKQKFIAPSGGGNVDVVKGPWTDSATGKECEFYPASGNGTHQYVNITSTARVPAGSGFDLIGTAGLYTIKDTYGNSTLATPLFHLSIDGNYVYATTDNNTPTVGTNAMARIDIASSRSINYVVSSGGMISVYSQNGQTLVGYLYPNTDVSVSSGDSVRYIVQYNNRSGYVYKSSVSSQKGPTDYPGHIGWSDEVSGRTVSLIDTVVLASTDTGISTHNNIGITYSDGSNGTCTVTVNASAISGGTQRSVSSLSQVSLSSNHTSSTAYPVTVTYDDGTTGASTITVSTANYVQTNKTITYTANGTYTLSPTSPYGAMSSASITVNVPGGTSQQRTAIGLADTIVLPASHTGTATISGNYVEYDDDTETGNFPVRINASAVYQAGVAYGQDISGYHLTTVTLQGRETKFKGQYLYKKLQTTVNDRGSSAGTAYVPDNNGSYKLQGTQVGRSYYGTLYQLDDYDRPVSVGSGSWFLVSGSVGALFKGDGTSLKTESLYYGNGGSYNVCGDYQYCYVIDADGTVSYYSAGQTVSDTYYIRST